MNRQELALNIRKGKELAIESHNDYLRVADEESRLARACALGLALIGMYGNLEKAEAAFSGAISAEEGHQTLGRLLGIPRTLAREVNTLHCSYIPALEIARLLEEGKI